MMDEFERYIPVELRRKKAIQEDRGPGKPPPDRVVGQLRDKSAKEPIFRDISGTQDRAILLEETVPEDCSNLQYGPRVQQGSKVTVSITVADPDDTCPIELRMLHGPKQHTWHAGDGSRCELVELAVASMRVNERCVLCCGDPGLYADSDLNITKEAWRGFGGNIEYGLHLLSATPAEPPEGADDFLDYANDQKSAATCRLKEGKGHLALVKYQMLVEQVVKVISHARVEHEGKAPWLPDQVKRAEALLSTLELNRSVCFSKLERWTSASNSCSIVLATEPNNIKALFRRGQAMMKLGDIDSASRDFELALKVDPDNTEVKAQATACRRLSDRATDKEILARERRGQVERGKWD